MRNNLTYLSDNHSDNHSQKMNGMWYTWVLSTLSQQPERNDNLSKYYTEAYSKHIQTSKMELSTIFVKGSILDVSLDSECASAYKPLKTTFTDTFT